MTRRACDRENKYDDLLYKSLNLQPEEYLKVPTEGDPSKIFYAIRNYIQNGTSSIAIQACIAKLQVGILENEMGIALFQPAPFPKTSGALEEIIDSRKQKEEPSVLIEASNLVPIR